VSEEHNHITGVIRVFFFNFVLYTRSFAKTGSGQTKEIRAKMYVSNLGVDVDALDVVARGSVHLHAVGDGGATLTIGNVSKTHAVGTPSHPVSILEQSTQTHPRSDHPEVH